MDSLPLGAPPQFGIRCTGCDIEDVKQVEESRDPASWNRIRPNSIHTLPHIRVRYAPFWRTTFVSGEGSPTRSQRIESRRLGYSTPPKTGERRKGAGPLLNCRRRVPATEILRTAEPHTVWPPPPGRSATRRNEKRLPRSPGFHLAVSERVRLRLARRIVKHGGTTG